MLKSTPIPIRCRSLSRSCHGRGSLITWMLLLPMVFACESGSLKPTPVADPNELYWELKLNHRAVTLSTTPPYDTLTVTAVPLSYQGESLDGLPTPEYVSTDIATVTITDDGVLRAVKAGSQIVVVKATLTVDNVRHEDSLLVRVVTNAAPPVLASLSIAPVPPDTAKRGVTRSVPLHPDSLVARMTDTSGAPLTNILVDFRTSDPTVATIDNRKGHLVGRRPGSVLFDASATAFGVKKTDTLPYRIGNSITDRVDISTIVSPAGLPVTVFSPSEVRVGVGAMVLWASTVNTSLGTIDLTFAPADVSKITAANTSPLANRFVSFLGFCLLGQFDCTGGGNVMIVPPSRGALRTFTEPGVYNYHSASHGASGRVVVINEAGN